MAFTRTRCKWYEICPIKRFTDQGCLPPHWVENWCLGNWPECVRYQMEKRGEYHPDYMLPDGSLDKNLR